jgi:membrane protein YqaA with SNARE-associated domain
LLFQYDIQEGLEYIKKINQLLESIALQYGYLGIFIVSFIGASSVIFPIPYTALIFTLGSLKILDPLFIALAGGAGSAVGEFFGYFLGYYGRTFINTEQQKKMNYILKLFNKYGAFTVFLFALTPLPDDLLFIPLGIMHYNFMKAFLPSFFGKVCMCLILAYGGQYSIEIIENLLGGESTIITILISIILLIIIVIAMLKIDWEKYIPIQDKK